MRHKVLTVLGVLLVVGAIFGTGEDNGETSEATHGGAGSAAVSKGDAVEDSDSAGDVSGAGDGERSSAEDSDAGGSDTGDTATAHDSGTDQVTKPEREPKQAPRPRTYLVTRAIDGDTIELVNGQTVRIVGIDTPEVGECGYDAATAKMERLVLGERVRLAASDEDKDRYGRLLRFVNVGKRDAGLQQIKAGLAIARYDSRDGYGHHPREDRYIAADRDAPNKRCGAPKPRTVVESPAEGPAAGCAAGYSPCVPPYPPDVDCADVDGPIAVTGSDPHGLDADGDGVACEW
jgi:endonuclease YncB( thermonuclease family)